MEDKRYVLAAVFQRQLSRESVPLTSAPEFLLNRTRGRAFTHPPPDAFIASLSIQVFVRFKKKNSVGFSAEVMFFHLKLTFTVASKRIQCEESA